MKKKKKEKPLTVAKAKVRAQKMQTTEFNNTFTGEVPSELSVDSLKSLFNQMISE